LRVRQHARGPEGSDQCAHCAEERHDADRTCTEREGLGHEEGNCDQALDDALEGSHGLHAGTSQVITRVLIAITIVLAAVSSAAAQSRIAPPPAETRRVAQPLAREIEAIAGRRMPRWIGYRTVAVPSARQSCNAPLALEPSKEMIVLVRVDSS